MIPSSRFKIINNFYKSISTTSVQNNLMEFFDDKSNWGSNIVKTGRPWKIEELRLKSNQDLHKLWYVLLKERNMLMTMEHEYQRIGKLMPSPERFEKVEESMDNILELVKERDNAFSQLENGENVHFDPYKTYNEVGIYQEKEPEEHHIPPQENEEYLKMTKRKIPEIVRDYYMPYYMEMVRNLKRALNKQSGYINKYAYKVWDEDIKRNK